MFKSKILCGRKQEFAFEARGFVGDKTDVDGGKQIQEENKTV